MVDPAIPSRRARRSSNAFEHLFVSVLDSFEHLL
jgi:hypothetical protein